jgi:epoxide hydrolase-like predicted phosphatase
MPIRAVVFDIGGVLEITPPLGVSDRWGEQLGLKPGELDERLMEVWKDGSLGWITEDDVLRSIGEILTLNETQISAFMDDIWAEYLGTLNVELVEYFRRLRPRYQTAILSNSFVGARRKEQQAYQFEELCDFIIYSHEVGLSKPDSRIYALTCERLGLPPEEVLFVDDREFAIEGARAYGMHAIQFIDNAQVIADIEACLQQG